MALDEGEKLQVAELVAKEVEQALGKKIPRLMRFEELTRPVVAGIALAVALPLSYLGLNALVEKQAATTFNHLHDKQEDGPKVLLKKFSARLKETFEGQVDSATFKLLRFGCNSETAASPAPKFPVCAAAMSGATLQAKFALDEEEQTIAFAARPQHQSVKLALALRPVDPQNVLKRVALQIEWLPLDVRDAERKTAKKIVLDASKLSKADYLVKGDQGPVLGLYGVSDGMDQEAINMEIDLTEALKPINSTLHQLKIRAVSHPEGQEQVDGTERFFLRALVSVNHKVVAP
ncbi:MAG TPA: hypothetical protein VEA35_11255 [Ramlibacter sp.]|nr:hypothetical protein [Ramlibacter sp.]